MAFSLNLSGKGVDPRSNIGKGSELERKAESQVPAGSYPGSQRSKQSVLGDSTS